MVTDTAACMILAKVFEIVGIFGNIKITFVTDWALAIQNAVDAFSFKCSKHKLCFEYNAKVLRFIKTESDNGHICKQSLPLTDEATNVVPLSITLDLADSFYVSAFAFYISFFWRFSGSRR